MKNYDAILQSIRALASGRQPETDISKLLFRHNCMYLLSQIDRTHPYSHPLITSSLINQICVKERYRWCQNVFRTLEEASIPYAVIKGAVLSMSIFGNPYCRHSGDIDLLVTRRDIDQVKDILRHQGFVQGRIINHEIQPYSRRELLFQSAMSHQAAPFVKHTKNTICPFVNVDVNMDIMWGESTQKADMDFILKHTVPTEICGIVTRKLMPEMEFISMCLHHYKDMNSIYLLSQGSLKLNLFCDIYFYVTRQFETGIVSPLESCGNPPGVNLEFLLTLCKKLKVTEYVYYCLYHANIIFDNSTLENLCGLFASPAGNKLLNSYGLTDSEFQEWSIGLLERLFDLDINEYFSQTLPQHLLEKIQFNKTYM